MANLEVNYCGVKYRNPLLLASSAPGWDGEALRLAAKAGAGGVIPKTIGPKMDWAAHPRNGRFWVYQIGGIPVGQINLELFTTMTRDDWIQHELEIAKAAGATMHISILALPNPDETAKLVQDLQGSGMVDIFELNVSCPLPATAVGLHIGKSAELTYQQIKAAKAVSQVPVTVKLTPNVPDMIEIASAAKEAGADGLTISNGVRAFAGVNIETGKPNQRACAGFTGPAIKPIVMRHVCEVAKNVDIPISAVGGVSSFKDIVEYIMLGATTVQTATTVMWKGYGIIGKMLSDLNDWMDKKGYCSVEEMRGIALNEITTIEELAKEPPKYASIKQDQCTSCGKCMTVCFYRAISRNGRKMVVDKLKCDGCGACTVWCPANAVTLM